MFVRVFEVFLRFLLLGCISFGGPAAHIGYFQNIFVVKLKWLDQHTYGTFLSLSQFLPGPGSSQLGFSIGMHRAGISGGIAAFIGFTLPSFILLYFLAVNIDSDPSALINGVIKGLKLLAVVVVADACITMFSSFAKTQITKTVTILTTITMLLIPHLFTQIFLLIFFALIGVIFYNNFIINNKLNNNKNVKNEMQLKSTFHKKNILALFLFLFPFIYMLIAPLVSSTISPHVNFFNQFYQAGSMVFGGGHVVLPLLQQALGDSLSTDSFMIGYASAQAVPGPMFTLATFLGANLTPDNALIGAIVSTLAIFLPGFLLLIAIHDSWQYIANKKKVLAIITSINAAVVGFLISALYQPVFISAVMSSKDIALVISGFYLLRVIKLPIIALVILFVAIGFFLY